MTAPLLSIVIPVFNEEENVPHIVPAVDAALAPLRDQGWRFEYVFTDNHSTDRTFELLAEISASDPRVRVLRFSRNFGYQKSIRAGYRAATGDCVAQLDADLQDPPELLIDMVRRWESGVKVIYGVRRTRKEGMFVTIARKLFYRVIRILSEDDLPVDSGDFRLLDRAVVDVLGRSRTAFPYLRGEIAGMGFRQEGLVYDRNARERGTSKFPLRAMIALALDGIVAQSVVPLRLASYLGLAVTLLTMFVAAGYLLARLFFDVSWPQGFATTTLLLLLGISLNALFLGIIGEYLARIYKQVSGRSDVIVEAELGNPMARGDD